MGTKTKSKTKKVKKNMVEMEQLLVPMSEEYISSICFDKMPKKMSDWFEKKVSSGQYAAVKDDYQKGYAMKSRNCTIVMFPNYNCSSQFRNIVNRLRMDIKKK